MTDDEPNRAIDFQRNSRTRSAALNCFIALGLAPAPGPSMEAGLRTLRDFPELSVSPAANLHVTLAFMGQLDDAEISSAADAASAAAVAAGGGWKLAWGKAGAFPSLARPRVVWLGLADGVITARVRRLLVAELRLRGLPVDQRPFRPHLTLARVRSGLSRQRAEDLAAAIVALGPPVPAAVEALVLYRSHLGRGAAVYEQLARASL